MTVPDAAGPPSIILCVVCAVIAWIRGVRQLRGSTLVAFWAWWLASISAIAACTFVMFSWAGGERALEPENPLAFLAAVSIFGSTMALLGARRPQHVAWNFVVATLWCVLALPALEAALMRPGESLQLHGLRGWFLWILIAAEVANRVATRMWMVGVLHACAAVLLLAPYLPLIHEWQPSRMHWLLAVGVDCAAIVLCSVLLTRGPRARSWDQVWLDFRDRWGVLWSLRVMERWNAAAQMYGWPLRLDWRGFRNAQQPPPEFETTFVNLMRRFVSDSFVNERMRF